MAKYIELIDKYCVEQGDGEYNPPSYRWVDNTGEIVRCGECRYWDGFCDEIMDGRATDAEWYCAGGERKDA